jgi:hypothetical protein
VAILETHHFENIEKYPDRLASKRTHSRLSSHTGVREKPRTSLSYQMDTAYLHPYTGQLHLPTGSRCYFATIEQYWITASILDFSATACLIYSPIELNEREKIQISA